jgi:isorenieratene synthase
MALSQVVGRFIGVREHEVDPGGGGAPRVPHPAAAVVVGGGIAGMSAAVVLADPAPIEIRCSAFRADLP